METLSCQRSSDGIWCRTAELLAFPIEKVRRSGTALTATPAVLALDYDPSLIDPNEQAAHQLCIGR